MTPRPSSFGAGPGPDAPALPLVGRPGGPLAGDIAVPGDKSISHRALMLGALAVGETRITGLLEGEDVLRTAAAMAALGAEVARGPDGVWRVSGRGVGGLVEPAQVLDLGNSGTGARLLMGICATTPMTTFFTGDASLCRRPMARVAGPLEEMGARVIARRGARLPLALIGAAEPLPIVYRLPVPSAQVKSAILLAGLNAPGETTVIEAEPTRDHTERMLRHFGAVVTARAAGADASQAIVLAGRPELVGSEIAVPGDPSSAAFPLAGALIVPGSEVIVRGVGLNRRRTGFFESVREMGADLSISNTRTLAGEELGDLCVRWRALSGIEVPAARAPAMIDEYPILAVVAAFARGTTLMRGLAELRAKESDRLSAIAEGLARCGVHAEIVGNDLAVHGLGGAPAGGGRIETRLDHRIAMAFLVMGLGARAAVSVDDARPIDTSFPGFVELMRGLGADLAPGAEPGGDHG